MGLFLGWNAVLTRGAMMAVELCHPDTRQPDPARAAARTTVAGGSVPSEMLECVWRSNGMTTSLANAGGSAMMDAMSDAQSQTPENPDHDTQPIEERVNNRSQKPSSQAFKEFMGAHWAPPSTSIPVPDAVAPHAAARRRALSGRFPGERLGPARERAAHLLQRTTGELGLEEGLDHVLGVLLGLGQVDVLERVVDGGAKCADDGRHVAGGGRFGDADGVGDEQPNQRGGNRRGQYAYDAYEAEAEPN